MAEYTHTFPAVRGHQAGKPCYIAMCPLRLVPKIFVFNETDVAPDLRAQRKLNIARVPEIASYLIENPRDYTLSAITASIDGAIVFEPQSDTGLGQNIGTLSIPMDAQILINDGQHRRAAIEQAIKDNPELGYDNIPVLFLLMRGCGVANRCLLTSTSTLYVQATRSAPFMTTATIWPNLRAIWSRMLKCSLG